MNTLESIVANPSGWDSSANYIGETLFNGLEVVMTRSRESDLLTESNWDTALTMLGGESDSVVIHRFGHWACGWWEALCVMPNTAAYIIGEDIVKSLANYPVLDEEDWSQREDEEAQQVWADRYNDRERVEYIRNSRNEFNFHDFAEMLAVARGKYFNGYASELIQP
jgi:hypothetical protein